MSAVPSWEVASPAAAPPHPAPHVDWRARAVRMVRCMAVSVLTTGLTLGILTVLVAAVGIHATAANVVGTAAGTAVSFELNRRWVWRHRGPVGLRRQVLPFWLLSFAGLALSSLAVEVTARATAGLALSSLWRAGVADAANVGTFGSLWVVQFLLLERWLFSPQRNRTHRGAGHATRAVLEQGWTRLRRRPGDPPWVRPVLVGLLAATGLLYLWGLGASGWANAYYSAAVQAGTESWKAFFFGSSDAANFITIDKAPGFLWPMVLSARLFGVNAWSILVPQALEGVAAVAVLYAAVRRWHGPAAGLLAGAVLALTPAATLIFRYDNPDALLVLLLTAAAYALVRAMERAGTGWVVLAGALVGFGFLAKMLQALLVVPGFALVYLLAAPTPLPRRIRQLALSGLTMAGAGGWWVAVVQLIPGSARPYIGGSQDNSLGNLVFGYNGFGRLTGDEVGSVGGGGPAGSRWGVTSWSRLFNAEMGGHVSWLLPAALVLLAAALVLTRRGDGASRLRVSLGLWAGWLLVTAAVFSFGQGIIHPYYTVALAPPLAAIVGTAGSALWEARDRLEARLALAGALLAATTWSAVLLRRAPSWHPQLRTLILLAGVAAAVVVVIRLPRLAGASVAVAVSAVVVALAGTGAWALATAATPHAGAIPSAGPAGVGGFGGRGPLGGGGFPGGPMGIPPGGPGGGLPGTPAAGQLGLSGPAGTGGGLFGGAPQNGRGMGGGLRPGDGTGAGRGGPGLGGLLNGSTPTADLTELLSRDADAFTWVAATVQSNQAAGYQLATGRPVMALGGFNGTDPFPTLAQFQRLVEDGAVHWFIQGSRGAGGQGAGGQGPGLGGTTSGTPTASNGITAWVSANFPSTIVGGVTVYDLTRPRLDAAAASVPTGTEPDPGARR